ncbi:MAG: hypothetical protein ACRDRO_23505 [Pseudonocardiaceae bacterium]
MTHQCPYPHCETPVPADQLTCTPHWYALPSDLKAAVWRHWKAGNLAEHATAKQAAIEWMNYHETVIALVPLRFRTKPEIVHLVPVTANNDYRRKLLCDRSYRRKKDPAFVVRSAPHTTNTTYTVCDRCVTGARGCYPDGDPVSVEGDPQLVEIIAAALVLADAAGGGQ